MSGGRPAGPESGAGAGGPRRGASLASPLRATLFVLNCVGTAIIFGLMLLINGDVWSRELFNRPIDGVPEMIELLIVAIVFLQLGDATRAGRLTRSDGLFHFILKRTPSLGRLMGAVFDLLGAAFMLFILWGTWPIFVEAYEKKHHVGDIGRFNAPTWPVKLIIVIGCVMVLLQFVAFAWNYLIKHEAEAPGPLGPVED